MQPKLARLVFLSILVADCSAQWERIALLSLSETQELYVAYKELGKAEKYLNDTQANIIKKHPELVSNAPDFQYRVADLSCNWEFTACILKPLTSSSRANKGVY